MSPKSVTPSCPRPLLTKRCCGTALHIHCRYLPVTVVLLLHPALPSCLGPIVELWHPAQVSGRGAPDERAGDAALVKLARFAQEFDAASKAADRAAAAKPKPRPAAAADAHTGAGTAAVAGVRVVEFAKAAAANESSPARSTSAPPAAPAAGGAEVSALPTAGNGGKAASKGTGSKGRRVVGPSC